jgi:hypothetical protein
MKKKARYFVIFCFAMHTASCSNTEKVTKEFIAKLNEPNKDFKDKIRFDGGYQKTKPGSADDPYLYGSIFFFNNGMAHIAGSFRSLDEFTLWYSKYASDKSSLQYWGAFHIADDTVKAIMYVPYQDGPIGSQKLYEAHYQGILANRDSILQWHVVPPYPSIDLRAGENKWLFEHEKEAVNLYFKNVPVEKVIDPSKAWINKYRKQ